MGDTEYTLDDGAVKSYFLMSVDQVVRDTLMNSENRGGDDLRLDCRQPGAAAAPSYAAAQPSNSMFAAPPVYGNPPTIVSGKKSRFSEKVTLIKDHQFFGDCNQGKSRQWFYRFARCLLSRVFSQAVHRLQRRRG